MNEPSTSTERRSLATAASIAWPLLIIATLYICFFHHLGAIGLVGPDEPRYAWIARDMAESGDWVTPRLYGQPWFEKPVLYYWAAALSFKLFGVNEAAARLPSAISALLTTLAMGWWALRFYGRETARWVLLLLPSTVAMIGFSHAASTDMLFSSMLTLAMVCAAITLNIVPTQYAADVIVEQGILDDAFATKGLPTARSEGSSQWVVLMLFGFFLGLAALAKGPAALILSGGTIAFWGLLTRRWRDAFRLLHPAAAFTFCITALPWYILCARRNPNFLHVFIIEHNFQRYLTPEFQHIQPFWYYLPVLFAAFLPWTLGFLTWFSQGTRTNIRLLLNGTRFLFSFALFPVLFFSLSHSKLPGYVLPAVGPLGCLLARGVSVSLASKNRAIGFVASLFALTSLALAAAGHHFAAHGLLAQSILPAAWTTGIWFPMLVAGAVAAILTIRRGSVAPVCVVHMGILLVILGLVGGIGNMDPQLSARGVLKVTRDQIQLHPGDPIYAHDVPRDIRYGLNFYLRRELPQWTPAVPAPAFVFSSWKSQKQLEAAGYSCSQHIGFSATVFCTKPGRVNDPSR